MIHYFLFYIKILNGKYAKSFRVIKKEKITEKITFLGNIKKVSKSQANKTCLNICKEIIDTHII